MIMIHVSRPQIILGIKLCCCCCCCCSPYNNDKGGNTTPITKGVDEIAFHSQPSNNNMATLHYSYLQIALILSFLSYTSFANENYITTLVSDGSSLRDSIVVDDGADGPSFSSLQVEAIYQFGNSLSDTGNLIRENSSTDCAQWPYEQTISNKPTGRCSDGLLMIDYFAKFLNIPFIDVYLNEDGNFTYGVNFAVGGATALPSSTLKNKYNGISTTTDHSLSAQLGWFRSYLDRRYPKKSAVLETRFAKGLFIVGEIGGNDYIFAFSQGKTLPEVYKMVPEVVHAIKSAVEEIIKHGATHILVPGQFPIGCVPVYLQLFKTNDSSMYDELNCLKQYNNHSIFHNDLLQQSIMELQKDHPNVVIIYMDYFTALKDIIRDATLLGFDENALQDACCGNPPEKLCGTSEVPVCKNPETRISWDGIHFTQQTYYVMAKKFIWSVQSAFQRVAYI